VRYPNGWDDIARFYGWPAFRGDLADWERRMVVVRPPEGVSFFFDKNANQYEDFGEHSRGLRVHPILADDLVSVLAEVKAAGLWEYVASVSGAYAWRNQRGSATKLSMHSLGAALDFNAPANPLGTPPAETLMGSELGLGVVRIFERHGWTWGGRFSRPDAMHFQAGGRF
jgi:hypothetical protein